MDLKLSGQTADPEIVRENFNKIMRAFLAADSNVIRLQSEAIDYSALGPDMTIRTFTVFMQSDTDVCQVTIPYARTFSSSVINKNNTIWIFKGVSGASIKSVVASSGDTIDGEASIVIEDDQTVAIQSNGEEYKILFDTTAGGGGGGVWGTITGTLSDQLDLQAELDLKLDQTGSKISATASGTNTYTATITPAIASYLSTQFFSIKFTNANTGAATLNLNTLGAKSIKKNVTDDLVANDIRAGQVMILNYDGTNFQLINGIDILSQINQRINSSASNFIQTII